MGLYKKEKREQQQITQASIIIKAVKKIREEQPKIGVRKLQMLLQPVLQKHNIKVGRDGLFDLMREFGLLVKLKRYKHYTTDSKHRFYKYPNQIKDKQINKSNQLWVSDITYIETGSKFNYLFLVTDAWSKKIVGYNLSTGYSAQGATVALKMAFNNNKIAAGLIHHSDRGIQYCSKEYTLLLKKKKAVISMTENSDPYENAIAERVNGILKTELLKTRYDNEYLAQKAIQKAVTIYNTKRPHLSIGLLTPQRVHTTNGTVKKLWKNYRKQNNHQYVSNMASH
jgi:transposase InsO family protein